MIYQTTGKVISTDPSGPEGDTTTWEYDLATRLELHNVYADGKGTVTQMWKEKRNLLAEMLYTRLNGAGNKVERAAGMRTMRRDVRLPAHRRTHSRDNSFRYNDRSELTGAKLGEAPYAYSYDNIGNRITAQEDAEHVTYEANNLNQYTQIDMDGTGFVPEYDADGNQTRARTSTGIWKVQYNGQNRAIRYEDEADSTHVITCMYDSQGRRVTSRIILPAFLIKAMEMTAE